MRTAEQHFALREAGLAQAFDLLTAPAADKWRKLAQQFDGQRMAAMTHLRTLLDNPQAHAEAARQFLASTPAEQIASVPQAPAPEVQAPAGLAHEIWAAAQLAPGEGIEDGVGRVEKILGAQAPAVGADDARDAARYRWLRDTPWPAGLQSVVALHQNARWDAAIDAAMAHQPPVQGSEP